MPKVVINSNTKGNPRWMADDISENVLPIPVKLDPTQFVDSLGVRVTSTGIVAQGATAIPVTAISGAIPKGTVLDFGGAKYARLSADAAAGAVSLAVDALPTALAANDFAIYSKWGRKMVPSGTLVGRTYTERDAGTSMGAAVDTDDEIYLTAFDIADLEGNDYEAELIRHGSVIKANYLPDWTTISANANLLAKLRALYTCITGVD